MSFELDRGSSRPPPHPTAEIADGSVSELFKRLEKAFPALKHYGGDHPESLAKVRGVHRAIVELLRDEPEGLRWEVHPFCFTRDGATVWEPGPPLDQLPYNLASAGVERVHIRAGVSEEEVHAFLRAVIIEPQLGGDESDIGAELWEAGLTHIVCSIRDDFGANDARAQVRFFDEADELEQELREELADLAEMLAGTAKPLLDREGAAEMAALAMASDKSSFKALGEPTTALWIEPAMKTALSSQMNVDPEEWRERFLDVVVVGLDDAVARGDGEVVLGALRLFAYQLAARSSWRELVDTHAELVDRLMARHPDDGGLSITRAMFPWEVVERAFEDARGSSQEAAAVATEALRGALPRLDAALLKPMLTLADDLRDDRLRELAFSYFDMAIADNEETVVEMLDDLGPELAQRMLASVAASAGETANELLRPLLLSNNPAVRCEAAALLSSSVEQLGKQLLRMLDSNDATLRAAALGTMLRHQVKNVGPALVQLVEAEGFSARPPTEQRQIFETLYALHPSRAERLLTGIVDQHGMLSDDTLDRVRASAAEVLGRLADSAEALEALENAARRRPWNTQMVRSTATAAIEAIKRRLGGAMARRVEP